MPRPGPLASSQDAARNTVYRDFQLFLDSIRKNGSRSPLSASQADDYYFPEARLQSFFADPHHLKAIVRAFLPSHVDHQLLRKGYAKVSAILLCLERGPDISRFLGKPSFSDTQLPFDNRDAFVALVDDETFYDDFYQYQWKFCTPKFELSWGWEWEKERILPFEIVKELGRGGGGQTYLIKLDREYNGLDESRQADTFVRLGIVLLDLAVLTSPYRIMMNPTISSSSNHLTPLMPVSIGKNYILMSTL